MKWIPRISLLALPIVIGGYLGSYGYLFDLLSNFKLQMAYGLGTVVCMNVLLGNWKTVAWSFCLFLLVGAELIMHSIPHSGDADGSRALNIYFANVLTSNKDHHLLVDQIQKIDPEVIALVEVDARWVKALDEINGYPFSKVIPRDDNFGIAIYSKYHLSRVEVQFFSDIPIPSLYCQIRPDENDEPISVLVTHPYPPSTRQGAISRNGALESMAEFVATSKDRTIVLGDLNITMWSPYYRKLEEVSGLYNARQGFGICPTWPSTSFTMIPLDHCLLSKDLRADHFETLESIGSDHLPFRVTVLY
jgi:endonuclease/exonuclease/phosphatase (EEP) superfamily protein YafD